MKKKICISFFLALVMVLAVAFPVSGALDTSSDTYYVADDPSNYSMVECSEEESDFVRYNLETGEKTYCKINATETFSISSDNIQKYWSGYILEGMISEADTYSTRDIIGVDTRIRITNTSVSPYSRIAYLDIQAIAYDDDSQTTSSYYYYPATGWFVYKNIIVTAAHNVFDSSEFLYYDGYCVDVTVVPGASEVEVKEEEEEEESVTYVTDYDIVTATDIYITSSFERYENDSDDYAVIVLDEDIGLSTGWFSMSSANDHTLSVANITGYTADRDGSLNRYMYRSTGSISDNGTALSYQMDTEDGNSGSPIYDTNHNVVGIHTRGTPSSNYGVPIDNDVYSFIMTIINENNF